MIYFITFISLAAICKSIADTVVHHYDTSIFRWNDFFNPNKQGKKLPFTNYPFDGWHLANSGMICFFIAAAVLHKYDSFHLHWAVEIIIAGTLFILVFNTFYNKIFR